MINEKSEKLMSESHDKNVRRKRITIVKDKSINGMTFNLNKNVLNKALSRVKQGIRIIYIYA